MSPAPRARISAAPSPFTGKTIGRCRIGRPIGRGATATVFHATYLPLKRDVAVKILRQEAEGTAEARERFIEEARALAKLDHGNVVRVFDVVEEQGYLLIIMDFVEGRSLREAIDEDGPLDPEDAVDVARQVALALDHAHAARILHRDVKPGNIIVRDDGKAVLVDFGNAEAAGEVGDRKGTAHYVAPEVFQGKKQDEKSDTYSLGATLFHMLTGEPPYEGQSTKEILQAHEAGRLRSPSLANPEAGIPKELDGLVKRAMAPARGYRFAARDFAAALEGVVAAIQSGPRRVRTRKPRTRGGTIQTRSAGPLVLGGIVLVAAVVVAVAASSGRESKPASTPAPPTKVEKAPETAAGPPEDHPVGPGIEKRAESRAARDAAAEKALREAMELAARSGDKPKAVADRFAAVASEYAELSQGRRAKEEEKAWRERAMTGGERESRAAAEKAEREREIREREEGLRRVAEAVADLRFSAALGALQEIEPPGGKHLEWKRREERLNLLIGFVEMLEEGLQGRPVGAYEVRSGLGKAGEKIVSASGAGLALKSPAGERILPWKETKPSDVLGLARRVLRNAPEPRMALAAWCWETDLRAEAKKEMDTALLTDRTGTVPGRLEELFGPEEQR